MAQERELTIIGHLIELRGRLMWAIGALVVGTLISMLFARQALELLLIPLGDYLPQAIHPSETFATYFKVAFIGGVAIAMPVIVYEIIAFILPGMMPNERRYLKFMLPGVTFCFLGGVAFAGFVMLPAAVQFLQGFLSDIIENQWTLESYIAFVTKILFWIGLVFETPLVIFLLAKLEIVTAQQLRAFRKYAILVAAIIAAVVTPTPDPVNMMLLMVPIYLLFEVGVILARIAQRNSRPAD